MKAARDNQDERKRCWITAERDTQDDHDECECVRGGRQRSSLGHKNERNRGIEETASQCREGGDSKIHLKQDRCMQSSVG